MKTSPAPKKPAAPRMGKAPTSHAPDITPQPPAAPPQPGSEPAPAVIAPDSIALAEIREAAGLQSARIRALLNAPHVYEEGMKAMLRGTADFLDGVALR